MSIARGDVVEQRTRSTTSGASLGLPWASPSQSLSLCSPCSSWYSVAWHERTAESLSRRVTATGCPARRVATWRAIDVAVAAALECLGRRPWTSPDDGVVTPHLLRRASRTDAHLAWIGDGRRTPRPRVVYAGGGAHLVAVIDDDDLEGNDARLRLRLPRRQEPTARRGSCVRCPSTGGPRPTRSHVLGGWVSQDQPAARRAPRSRVGQLAHVRRRGRARVRWRLRPRTYDAVTFGPDGVAVRPVRPTGRYGIGRASCASARSDVQPMRRTAFRADELFARRGAELSPGTPAADRPTGASCVPDRGPRTAAPGRTIYPGMLASATRSRHLTS